MKHRILSALLVLCLLCSLFAVAAVAADDVEAAASLGDTCVETSSETIDGTVYAGTMPSGNPYLAYVPTCAQYGERATANPILVVYGDTAFTAETAKQTAIDSGLAAIADREGGPIIFVNPKGDAWTADDAASYTALKSMFSDSTATVYNNEGRAPDTTADDGTVTEGLYPGTITRTYVFAEGKGADFAYEYLAQGVYGAGQYSGNAVWRPVGLLLLNPTSTKAVDLAGYTVEGYDYLAIDQQREIPAYIINGNETITAAFTAQNSEDQTIAVTSEAKTLGEAKTDILKAYDSLFEHYFTRDNGFGVNLVPLYSASQVGMIETKETFTASNGNVITYYQYIPEDYESAEDGSIPLVFGFHGSANHAEMLTWSSGWLKVAGDNGFMFVSVDDHSQYVDEIIEILEALEEKYPCIDSSRIYASGFSMGSMKTFTLASKYDDIFAAIFPFNLAQNLETAHGYLMPTFYNGGEQSHFNMPFMMGGARSEIVLPPDESGKSPSTSMIDAFTSVLVNNGAMVDASDYVYDANAEGKYGYQADDTVTMQSVEYPTVTLTMCKYDSADGNCYTVMSSTSNTGHEPVATATAQAWEFMSQFSRNEDGTIAINGEGSYDGTFNGMKDVSVDDYYADAVAALVASGIMPCREEGIFAPTAALTRGELISILYRVAGSPAGSGTSFADIAADAAIADAAYWAKNAGVALGDLDGNFRPDEAITRQDALTILCRMAQGEGEGTLDSFGDAALVADYAENAVLWAVSAGYLQGGTDGNLNPLGTIMRAEAALILSRYTTK